MGAFYLKKIIMAKPTTTWTPADGSSTITNDTTPTERVTEDGTTRVTESGETRVLEAVTITPKPKTNWSEHDE